MLYLNLFGLEERTYKDLPYDEKYIQFGKAIKKAVSDVRKYKTERNISMKEPIANLKISLN